MIPMTDYYRTSINSFLRDPPNNLARSAYAVEINPWVRRGDIESALLFRGTIVSAYGYIETRLRELSIRCSHMPEYGSVTAREPRTILECINYIRLIFSHGPLVRFQKITEQFLLRFEAMSNIRNQAAHARMQVLPDWGATFLDFIRVKGVTHIRQKPFTKDELEGLAWRAAKLSRLCQLLADHLQRQIELPEL